LQYAAVCCSVLRCVVVCCSVLQFKLAASLCLLFRRRCVAVCCGVLQCVAVCCSVVAMCCNVLQCVASRCSSNLQTFSRSLSGSRCVALCCNNLITSDVLHSNSNNATRYQGVGVLHCVATIPSHHMYYTRT